MRERINKASLLLSICSLLIIVVTCIGAYNALARFIGRQIGQPLGSNLFIELQWYLFSAIFLFGGIAALKLDRHVRVDVFYAKFSPKAKKYVNLFTILFLVLPFTAAISYVSYKYFSRSLEMLEQSPNPDGLPRYIVKALIPLSFGGLFLQALGSLRSLFKQKPT